LFLNSLNAEYDEQQLDFCESEKEITERDNTRFIGNLNGIYGIYGI
jgi:hypothetical protein